MNSASGRLRLFVYGTLKRGYSNHARYFGENADTIPARLRGRLYDMKVGYPILTVPSRDVLAVGTADPLADLATQMRVAAEFAEDSGALPRPPYGGCHAPPHAEREEYFPEDSADWPLVEGEIIELDDAARRLPPIDALEDFVDGRDGLYRRVLVRTAEPAGAVVWTYIAPDGRLPRNAKQIGNRWTRS